MKKGGLLRDLENKIKTSQEYMNEYEKQLVDIKTEMEKLNYEYDQTYINYNYINNNKFNLEYRDDIMNLMYNLNETYKFVLNNLEKQKKITKFLMNCYYYVDKSMY